MKITRENCEAWFLDYYEGNLSKEGVEEMFAFLVMNPDLKEIFDSYEDVYFDNDNKIKFEGKDALKKEVPASSEDAVSETNYQQWFVAFLEGELNTDGVAQVNLFLEKNPHLQGEMELLKKTILIPEKDASASLSLEWKNALKKSLLITEVNFDEYAVLAMDQELSMAELAAFSAYVSAHPQARAGNEKFLATKLVADEKIIFANKNSLKKNERDRGGFVWWREVSFAAAAMIVLLVGFFVWSRMQNETAPGKTNVIAKNGDHHSNPSVLKKDSVVAPGIHSPSNNSQIAVGNTIHPKNSDRILVKNISANDNKEKIVFAEISPRYSGNVLNEIPVKNYYADYSGVYYDAPRQNIHPNAAPASNDISVGQYAMRWVKNKLDRRSNNETNDDQDHDDLYAMNKKDKTTTGDVTGFDLTSSALDRVSYATGANVHLAKNDDGTVFTVGKYDVLLNRN
ncbi:MAG: hypothetical protein HY064_02200 [Bacteroidetes bacterium]|nr:hypothetical protein [Bacteroidota bacterium]